MATMFSSRFGSAIALMLVLLLAPIASLAAESGLVGKKTLNFSLPSSQGRLITYGDQYYGRHHLIMTFFPAAFTPV